MKIKNPVTATETELIGNGEDGWEGFKEKQELPDQALEEAKELSWRMSSGRPNTQSHWRHIGRIPHTIYQRLKEQGIAGDKIKMMLWLEENKRFLVTPKDKI